MFLVGPYQRRRLVELGLFERDDPRLVDVGMPKLDALARGEVDGAAVRAELDVDASLPCVVYAPTWGDHSSLATIGEPLIRSLAERATVIVKPHDHHLDPTRSSIDWGARLRDLESDRVRIYRRPDVVPALAAADVLVSDASSVSQEFTLLDRPMILVETPALYRSERYRDTIDLDTWGLQGGEVITDANQARDALERCLARPGERSAIRRAIAKDLFHHPGRATDVALDAIYAELSLSRPTASDPM